MLELGIMLFANSALGGGARAAARTGQVQLSASGVALFQSELCARLTGVIDCARVAIDVRAFPSFGALSLPPLTDQVAGQPLRSRNAILKKIFDGYSIALF